MSDSPNPRPTPFTRRDFLRTVAGGALAGSALALAGCSPEGGTAPAAGPAGSGSAAPRTIRVVTFKNNHVAAPLFWQKFAPAGVTIDLKTMSSGSDMNNALQAGDVDFSTFGIINGFVQAEAGHKAKIIGMGACKGAGLIVKKDSSYTTVESLKGARVGIKAPSFQSLLFLAMLEKAGLNPDKDVTIVPCEWGDMVTLFDKGDLDAFMGTEPHPSRSVASGKGRRLVNPYDTPVGQLNSALWAAPHVQGDGDLCRLAVNLQRQAANYMSPGGVNDQTVWKELIVKGFGLDEAVFAEMVTNVGAVWELNDSWIGMAKAAGDKMAQLGILKAKPDYDRIITTEFQPKAS